MLKLALFAACVVAVLAAPSARDESLIVQTTGGAIQGQDLSAGLLDGHYYSFRGIPYAVPPLGDLRFRAPLAHPGWEGIRDGSEHGLSCAGGLLGTGPGVEDCLTLNVYSPNMVGSRPVMFWIHGGSFSGGSGDSFVYGPEHLIPEDVLVVTVNYRLGVAGFLSTGDNESTGNYGMKDCILALKWVRDNIAAFGGDPDNVTIFGESAGGAAVHFLVLSPQANGLFAKAISQSGSALNPWAYQPDPLTPAKTLAEALEIEFTTTAALVEALREVPYELLREHNPGSLSYPYIRGLTPIPFVPTRDPAGVSAEEAFLPDEPINIMTAGTFNHVPYISGYTSDESLFMIRELLLDAGVFDVINNDTHLFVPQNWGLEAGSDASEDIIQQVKDMYFHGTELLVDYRYLYTQYCSDLMFLWGIDRTVRLHAERQAHPVYYYRFSFDGTLNLIKTGLFLNDYPGAVHADDIFYLFSVTRIPPPLFPTNASIMTRRRMVRMWANFAKTGNPTPSTDLIVNQLWTPVQGTQEFMDIDTTLIPGRFPNAARMQMWDRLLATYAPSH